MNMWIGTWYGADQVLSSCKVPRAIPQVLSSSSDFQSRRKISWRSYLDLTTSIPEKPGNQHNLKGRGPRASPWVNISQPKHKLETSKNHALARVICVFLSCKISRPFTNWHPGAPMLIEAKDIRVGAILSPLGTGKSPCKSRQVSIYSNITEPL